MRKFMPHILFATLTMASAITHAAESGFFIGVELNKGGEKIYPDPALSIYKDVTTGQVFAITGQKPQVSTREGDNTGIKIGYDWLIGDSLALRGAVGYASSGDSMNDNKNTQTPVELLLFYRNNHHRIGIGPVIHLQRTVESTFTYNKKTAANATTTPPTLATSVEYHTTASATDKLAKGFKVEYDYEPEWGRGLYLGLQYTYMRYEYNNKYYIFQGISSTGNDDAAVVPYSGTQNASSAGLSIGYRF